MMKVSLYISLILILASCSSQKTAKTELKQISSHQTDSVNILIEKTTKVMTIPQTTAKLTLTPEQITNLPAGASYQAKDGNASGTLRKTADNKLEFTANCDSLSLFVEELKTEVYHLNTLNTALVTKLDEQRVEEVNVLNGWQWFQIYGFRLYVFLTFILIIYKNIKNGKIKRLFQALSSLSGGI